MIPIDSCYSLFLLASSIGMLTALFGPIEEQVRLSIHPHILLWFVHTQSEQWLRRILRTASPGKPLRPSCATQRVRDLYADFEIFGLRVGTNIRLSVASA